MELIGLFGIDMKSCAFFCLILSLMAGSDHLLQRHSYG